MKELYKALGFHSHMIRVLHLFSVARTLIASTNLKFVYLFHHAKFLPHIQSLKLVSWTLISHASSFWLHLLYFVSISLLCFMALQATSHFDPRYSKLDIFFTSVSACTASSMSVMEMEVFSNYGLLILAISMFIGGEVFTSMLELRLRMFESIHSKRDKGNVVQLGLVHVNLETEEEKLRYGSIKTLFFVVIAYLLAAHVVGFCLITLYVSQSDSSKIVLRRKNLRLLTFSFFTTVSTFSNCGFLPTDENMVVFRKQSGLLLLLIPLVVMGNSLYAPILRFTIWVLEKATQKAEFTYILQHYSKIGFPHLLSGRHCRFLTGTVAALVALQLIVFSLLEWNSMVMNGMSQMEKMVGSLFQVVNSRHAGESVVDISALSPAILLVFVLMMYLPPYTSFMPLVNAEELRDETQRHRDSNNAVGSAFFSQLTYLTIVVAIVCVTESEKLKHDPLNFSVLFIVVEVISAYGNVGYSSGYSCQRQLTTDLLCRNVSYGLAGKWSGKGKAVLIVVMIFGRLKKKITMKGGMAWRLL